MSRVLKYSKHRESILMLLKSINSHPTAEWLYTELKKNNQNISVATVYRNLNLLCKSGDIVKVDVGDVVDHYDAVTCEHCHFVCRNCGGISDIIVPISQQINDEAQKYNNVLIEKNSLMFYGLCGKCK